jgi:transcription initiation factor TFIID subunit TAF12
LSEFGYISFNQIKDSEVNAQELITNLSQKLGQSEATLQEILNKITGYEREAANAKTNVDASASSALSNKESIEALLSRLSNGLAQQQDAQEKINSRSLLD